MELNARNRPLILLVEDSEDTAAILQFLFNREEYEVLHAKDGLQAKNLIDSKIPTNLVLLDIMIPHVSGLQLLRHIRSRPEWDDVPVIMLTSDSAEPDIVDALQSGAQDYVVKPFKPRELLARVARFLPPSFVTKFSSKMRQTS